MKSTKQHEIEVLAQTIDTLDGTSKEVLALRNALDYFQVNLTNMSVVAGVPIASLNDAADFMSRVRGSLDIFGAQVDSRLEHDRARLAVLEGSDE